MSNEVLIFFSFMLLLSSSILSEIRKERERRPVVGKALGCLWPRVSRKPSARGGSKTDELWKTTSFRGSRTISRLSREGSLGRTKGKRTTRGIRRYLRLGGENKREREVRCSFGQDYWAGRNRFFPSLWKFCGQKVGRRSNLLEFCRFYPGNEEWYVLLFWSFHCNCIQNGSQHELLQ